MTRSISVFFAATVLFFSLSARAQDATTLSANAPDADSLTNEPPKLLELMASNNVVTNTIGIVLIKISPTLWAGKYEVTQTAYKKLTGSNPSAFVGSQNPVDSVSWNDAVSFCDKLTSREKTSSELPKGFSYTLPTEAQWVSLMSDASLKDAVMKLNGTASSSTAPVGSLGANSLGLYDTRGNVMEWVLDSHDPAARILKGGAWDTFIEINARPEFQWRVAPDDKKNFYGFRVILTAASSQ